MVKNKLITIIVPIYKVEKYLKTCVDSLLNQTYDNLEIILVDDGSPDNCPQICDEYAKKDSRVKVIHKENGGLSSARNAGLDICKGDYISFVDSDDLVSCFFIEALLKYITDYGADISQCDYIRFQDDEKINSSEVPLYDKIQCQCFDSIQIQKKLYEPKCAKYVVACNKLYKSDLFQKVRFPAGKTNEDEFTTYLIYNSSNLVVTFDNPLYFYRINENSIMGKAFNPKRLDILQSFEERKKFYLENNNYELFKMVTIKYQDFLYEYFFKVKKEINDNKKYLLDIIKKTKGNYKDYIHIEKSKMKLIKNTIFTFMPNAYFLGTRIKDAIVHLRG